MSYTINYTDYPTEKLMYKITVDENIFGKVVEQIYVIDREGRDEAVKALKEKYKGALVTESRY